MTTTINESLQKDIVIPSEFVSYKKTKPTSPGRRHIYKLDKKKLWRKSSLKYLTFNLYKAFGRNTRGIKTILGRERGHKKKYRHIDFKRTLTNIPGIVIRVEYDPYRSTFISLVYYLNSYISYCLTSSATKVGDLIGTYTNVFIQKEGFSSTLELIPSGSFIYNIETVVGKGSTLCRAAGTYGILLTKNIKTNTAFILLPSGKSIYVPLQCKASLGVSSNLNHSNTNIGTAGGSRWLGLRPHNRGVSKNPVDHPHGGGEGKTSGGRNSVTPLGRNTKGQKTRKNKFKYILV